MLSKLLCVHGPLTMEFQVLNSANRACQAELAASRGFESAAGVNLIKHFEQLNTNLSCDNDNLRAIKYGVL